MSKKSRRKKIIIAKSHKKETQKKIAEKVLFYEAVLYSAKKQLAKTSGSKFRSLKRLSQTIGAYEKNLFELRAKSF